jgi:glyoxalase family protein
VEVDGFHHVTAITADIDANLEFYGRLLRLRLVWQGVNADDPEMRHIAYGDERGSPGSIVTFFDMPGVMRGRPGAGMVHRLLFRVASEKALDFWEHRLARAGVPSDRLADHLAFSDPEGLALDLVAWGERRHGLVIYDTAPLEQGIMGAGTMHHIAFTIREGEQDLWRSQVAAAGLRPTPVMDRKMFKSVYFREPSGILLEVATDQPGFVFEPPDRLGESLVLIGDLEHRRAELEGRFPLLSNPRASKQTAERTSA